MMASPHNRNTGRAIIMHQGKIVLIERWRPGKHYFSIPGGGIEPGESSVDAAVREVYEETSLIVRPNRLLYEMRDGPITHSIFLCGYVSGEPHLQPDSEEAQAGSDNQFLPRWVSLDELEAELFGYWQPVARQLVVDIAKGLPKEAKTLASD